MKQSYATQLVAILAGGLIGGYLAHKYTKAKCLEEVALLNASLAQTLREREAGGR